MLEIIEKGGVVSWILLLISIITIGIIILKFIQFAMLKLNNTSFVSTVLDALLSNSNDEVVISSLEYNRHPIAVTMLQTINMVKNGNKNLHDNIQIIGNIELIRLRVYVSWLDTIAHIAPMVGLLGTVIGMIKAFHELSLAGTQVDITTLSTGIWEALITTAFGLVISVVALIAVNIFETQIEKTKENMSMAIGKLLELLAK